MLSNICGHTFTARINLHITNSEGVACNTTTRTSTSPAFFFSHQKPHSDPNPKFFNLFIYLFVWTKDVWYPLIP